MAVTSEESVCIYQQPDRLLAEWLNGDVIDFEHQQRQQKLNRIAYVRNIKLQRQKESALIRRKALSSYPFFI